jgi:hypothetical protein
MQETAPIFSRGHWASAGAIKTKSRGLPPLLALCVLSFLALDNSLCPLRPSAFIQRHRRRPPSVRTAFPASMAGKGQILPADDWTASSVTERRLEELVEDGLLRPRMSRSRLEWIAPLPDHREPTPLKDTWLASSASTSGGSTCR